MPYLPLVEYTRGGIVESLHTGAVAVADAQGHLVASYGDPGLVTFLRSSAKPFQALPLVESGAAEAFDLTPRELALCCASHVGTDAHVEVAQSIQAKIGASEANLLCGVHDPTDPATAQRLLARGLAATPNRHNCSGKHSGMLALARHHDWPLDDYVNPRHPAQQAILAAFAEMCGLPEAEVVVGTDGCSAPNFAVPLVNAATAFARLANPGAAPGARGLPHRRANAVRTLFYAMTAHPEMVRGLGGFDTELMRRRPGLLVSKAGAEGYQGIGLAAGALRPGSPALGVALKVADGTGRAVAPAALAVLKQLGLLDEHDLELLAAHGHAPRQPLRNWRGLVVGEARAVLSLDFSGLG